MDTLKKRCGIQAYFKLPAFLNVWVDFKEYPFSSAFKVFTPHPETKQGSQKRWWRISRCWMASRSRYPACKWLVYLYIYIYICIFAFGEYNSKQVNVSGIQHYLAQIYGQEFCTENFNAANIYLFWIILTKCKYIYKSFRLRVLKIFTILS